MGLNSVVEFLSRLVEIPTVNDPIRGVKVGRVEAERVSEVIREFSGVEMKLVVNDGVPTLLHIAGSGRPVTLFMAHFDVVPPGSGWTVSEPFKPVISDGRLYGRGSADDKSNVAAISMALSGFEPSEGTIVVAFTGDEEVGGARGAGWLAGWLRSEGLWPDYLVNGDGSMGAVILRRRNAFNAVVRVESAVSEGEGFKTVSKRYDLEVRGRPTRHAAYFLPGVDRHPLLEASMEVSIGGLLASELRVEWVKSNVLPPTAWLEALKPGEGGSRGEYDIGLTLLLRALIPLSRITPGGLLYSDFGVTSTPNVYRREGRWHEVVIDIRAMTGDRRVVEERVLQALEEVIGGGVAWEAEVVGGGGYLYTPSDSRLARLALETNKALGLSDRPVEAAGASDSRYFSPHGVEAIDYGPRGGNVHGPDEYVEMQQLEAAVEFYRRIARALHG